MLRFLLVASLVGSLMIVGDASAQSGATGALVSVGSLEAPQGKPFPFEIRIENTSAQSLVVSVKLSLAPQGSDSPVAFEELQIVAEEVSTTSVPSAVVSSRWFTETGPYVLTVYSPEIQIDPLTFEVTVSPIPVPTFLDVNGSSGIGSTVGWTDYCVGDTYSAGAAWGDANGDGSLDLFLPRPEGDAQLWINDGQGHFSNQAVPAGVSQLGSHGTGAVFVDYDNDGDQDIHVVTAGPDLLFQNDGSGSFVDVAESAGIAGELPGASAAWGDYDADGHLDLYVVTWGRRCEVPGTPVWTYYPDQLFHSNGDGTFTDQRDLLHESGSTMGTGLQASWVDYDRDGDVDLYLANDFTQGPGAEPNHLWRNDGQRSEGGWRFTDVSAESGAGIAVHSMGVAIGDYDRDLDFDLAISNIGPTALLRNRDGLAFTDRAADARVDRPFHQLGAKAITWGLDFEDFNNDGWEDLFVAAGQLDKETFQPDELYTNGRNGKFLDHSAPSGIDDPEAGRGAAFADYDRDGLVDLFVVNKGGMPHLYRNVTSVPNYHWLLVDPVGRKSNREGCGVTIIAKLRRASLLRQVSCGSTSFASGNDPAVHFGLGKAKSIRELVFLWPSGRRQVKRDVRVDRLITVREPRS